MDSFGHRTPRRPPSSRSSWIRLWKNCSVYRGGREAGSLGGVCCLCGNSAAIQFPPDHQVYSARSFLLTPIQMGSLSDRDAHQACSARAQLSSPAAAPTTPPPLPAALLSSCEGELEGQWGRVTLWECGSSVSEAHFRELVARQSRGPYKHISADCTA